MRERGRERKWGRGEELRGIDGKILNYQSRLLHEVPYTGVTLSHSVWCRL